MTSVALPVAAGRPLWRAAQVIGVLATLVLIAAFWIWPEPSLKLLWDMVIPLLPAVFLVNPAIWRNVCPLATVNDLSGNRPGRASMSAGTLRHAWTVGIVLLFVLVPARRFLFNESGPALALTVTAVAGLALLMGFVFARRGGFCSSICPVLPVEKLYGQAPLVALSGVRCAQCTVCTPVGCMDLAGTKSVPQTIGPLRRDTGWLRTAFGVFAAAFPGFIVGYFLSANGAVTTALEVYARVFGLAAASYGVVAVLATVFRTPAVRAMPLLAAISLGCYYWYSAVTLATAYGAPGAAMPIRVAVGVLLLYWLQRTLHRGSNGIGVARPA